MGLTLTSIEDLTAILYLVILSWVLGIEMVVDGYFPQIPHDANNSVHLAWHYPSTDKIWHQKAFHHAKRMHNFLILMQYCTKY
ncbi:hypothetical protein GDO86_016632 [Hymenochirus boettgeri]|uniref:Uncharacterized protein n=1 Tax=Hymenochirus boettgeri TaxID=247094 RepID=A0A8T2K103_9PIPI|nr:hypothetical protein GDO86_016632 [Hymenochirus boettgeri]